MKRVKQLVMMAFASLLAQCVWAATTATQDEDGNTPYNWLQFNGNKNSFGSAEMSSGGQSNVQSYQVGAKGEANTAGIVKTWGNAGCGFDLGSDSWSIMIVGKMSATENGTIFSPGSVSHGSSKGMAIMSTGSTNQGVKVISFGDSNNAVELTASVVDAKDKFHVYVLSYDKTTTTYALWVDGVEKAHKVSSFDFGNSKTQYQFGGTHGGSASGTAGANDAVTDDFRVYHNVLSDVTQVKICATFGITPNVETTAAITQAFNGTHTTVNVCAIPENTTVTGHGELVHFVGVTDANTITVSSGSVKVVVADAMTTETFSNIKLSNGASVAFVTEAGVELDMLTAAADDTAVVFNPTTMPDATLVFEPTSSALTTVSPCSFFSTGKTGWDSEQFNANKAFVLGPNGAYYPTVQDGQHPWQAIPSKDAYTLSVYADIEDVATDDERILFSLGNQAQGHIVAKNTDGQIILRKTGTGAATKITTDCANLKGWHLYTMTYDKTNLKLYIDGVEKLTIATGTNANGGMQIGSLWQGVRDFDYVQGYGMAVAGVYGYDVCLSASQVVIASASHPAVTRVSAGEVNPSVGTTRIHDADITTLKIDQGKTVDVVGSVSAGTAAQQLKGKANILKGATLAFTGTTTDGIDWSADASHIAEFNVYGTMNMGQTRWTVGANNRVRVYGGTVSGSGNGYGCLDLYGQDTTILEFHADGDRTTPSVTCPMRARKSGCGIFVGENVVATISGVISQSEQGSVVKKGAGKLVLSGANTYAGGTTISAGTLETGVGDNLAGKTISVSTDAVLSYVNNSDRNHTGADFSKITGTGKIVLSGSGYVALPNSLDKMFASTLAVENNLENGMILSKAGTAAEPAVYEIGTLSGTGHIRTDMSSVKDSRSLRVTQSANSTWSGHVLACGSNEADRLNSLIVAGAADATEKTLTINGTFVDTLIDTLKVESTGSVKLMSKFYGPIVVDGALELAGGSWIRLDRGISGSGTVSQTCTDTVSLNATDESDGAIILEGVTVNQTAGTLSLRAPGNRTADAASNAIGYIKNATITSSSTLSCSGKIGVKGACSITKTSGTNNISSLELSEEGATLTLKGMTGVTVTSGVTSKKVATKVGADGATVYGLVDKNPEPITPTEGTGTFTEGTVITDANGEVVTTGNALPSTTGVYTVQAMQDGFKVGDPITYAVVNSKSAESADAKTVAVAVPFTGATVANLLNTALLNEGDEFKAYVGGSYSAWTLAADKKTWTPVQKARDGADPEAGAPATTELKRGAAVWVTTAGQVVAFGAYEGTEVEPEVTAGYNLIGNPMMTPITPEAKTVGDVLIPVGSSELVRYKVIEKAGGTKVWQCTKSVQDGVIPGTTIPAFGEDVSEENPTVQVGGSVWLIK